MNSNQFEKADKLSKEHKNIGYNSFCNYFIYKPIEINYKNGELLSLGTETCDDSYHFYLYYLYGLLQLSFDMPFSNLITEEQYSIYRNYRSINSGYESNFDINNLVKLNVCVSLEHPLDVMDVIIDVSFYDSEMPS